MSLNQDTFADQGTTISQPSGLTGSNASFATTPGARDVALVFSAASDVGKARDHQEDAVGYVIPADVELRARRGSMFVVADGMGGHNAGEVASQMAVAEIERFYFASAEEDLGVALDQAVASAGRQIYELAQGDAGRAGMGTTVAVAVIRHCELFVVSVGDSRVYLVRQGQIRRLTRDHSLVADQVRAGMLTADMARNHPRRNVITRALGTSPAVEPFEFAGTLQEGDVLLLCSDGLTGYVEDAELAALISQTPPQQATRTLIELANERGGSDNISAIVVRIEVTPEAVAPAAASRLGVLEGRSPLVVGLIGALIGAALGLIVGIVASGGAAGPRALERYAGKADDPAAATALMGAAAVWRGTPSPTPRPTHTPLPTYTLAPTYTPLPTYTLAPTYTSAPTYTPRVIIATPTETPTETPAATSTPPPPGTPSPTLMVTTTATITTTRTPALPSSMKPIDNQERTAFAPFHEDSSQQTQSAVDPRSSACCKSPDRCRLCDACYRRHNPILRLSAADPAQSSVTGLQRAAEDMGEVLATAHPICELLHSAPA